MTWTWRWTAKEPPAMDGSALPFAMALKEAGLADKPGQEKIFLRLAAPVEFKFR